MTSENRAELMRGIEAVMRAALGGLAVKFGVRIHNGGEKIGHTIRTGSYPPDAFDYLPDLTPFKTMCLAALVGEPIPPAALVGALEDAGIFPDGVLAAVRDEAYERGKRDGNPLLAVMESMADVVKAATPTFEAVAGLAARLQAAGVTTDDLRTALTQQSDPPAPATG